MGWIKNIFKSLADTNGEITQTEATQEELNEFLTKAGESSSSTRVNDLEKRLITDRTKLVGSLKQKSANTEKPIKKDKQKAKEDAEREI